MKPSILILCTGNSCRSHLAEGILRAVAGDILDVHSAGSKPAGYVAAASGSVPSYDVPIMPTLPVDQLVARTSSRPVGLV